MIEIYADGADWDGILKAAENPVVKGFTTNPTLMKQAGITNYEKFARDIILKLKQTRPDTNISLEVFADEQDEMYVQAKKIASWGEEAEYDVFVKIPVTNTKGIPNYSLINKLNSEGVKVNVTAVFTQDQTAKIIESLTTTTPVIISIFAGRIADTMKDPVAHTYKCISESWALEPEQINSVKFLWASCREQYHLAMAEHAGCHIITMLHDQIKKLNLIGKDLEQFSQETVQMFYNDAVKSGYRID